MAKTPRSEIKSPSFDLIFEKLESQRLDLLAESEDLIKKFLLGKENNLTKLVILCLKVCPIESNVYLKDVFEQFTSGKEVSPEGFNTLLHSLRITYLNYKKGKGAQISGLFFAVNSAKAQYMRENQELIHQILTGKCLDIEKILRLLFFIVKDSSETTYVNIRQKFSDNGILGSRAFGQLWVMVQESQMEFLGTSKQKTPHG